jgi:hypothetical protein
MTYAALEQGLRLKEQIKKVESVSEHLSRKKNGECTIDFLVRYFSECRNVGDDRIRKDLAEVALLQMKETLSNNQVLLEKELELL